MSPCLRKEGVGSPRAEPTSPLLIQPGLWSMIAEEGRTWERLVIPRTKHMESRMFDFPLPFSPVMALK